MRLYFLRNRHLWNFAFFSLDCAVHCLRHYPHSNLSARLLVCVPNQIMQAA